MFHSYELIMFFFLHDPVALFWIKLGWFFTDVSSIFLVKIRALHEFHSFNLIPYIKWYTWCSWIRLTYLTDWMCAASSNRFILYKYSAAIQKKFHFMKLFVFSLKCDNNATGDSRVDAMQIVNWSLQALFLKPFWRTRRENEL